MIAVLFIVEQSPEVSSIREMLSLTPCHVNDLDIVINVESFEGSSNVFHVVRCKHIEAVFPIQAQEAHVMLHSCLCVKLHRGYNNVTLTMSFLD